MPDTIAARRETQEWEGSWKHLGPIRLAAHRRSCRLDRFREWADRNHTQRL